MKWKATSFSEGLFSVKFDDADLENDGESRTNEKGLPLALTGNEHRLKYLVNIFHEIPKNGVYDDVKCYKLESNKVMPYETNKSITLHSFLLFKP